LIPLAGLNPNIRCTLDTKADFGILSRIYLEWYLKSNTESSYLELIRFIESDSDLVDTMKDQIEKHPKQV
jgi:spore coat polysaccharide biosynthesis protein SpsF (cytidylyltransferase family)